MPSPTRRDILALTAAGSLSALFATPQEAAHAAGEGGVRPVVRHRDRAHPKPNQAAWAAANRLHARVRKPRIPRRTFSITDFGAAPGGKADCSAAFAAAIAACHKAGGGRVVVPNGCWLTGPIRLRSRVELHLSDGAHVLFSTNPQDYLPAVLTRFEGVELYGYSPLVYALEETDIAVTGSGILDGQADDAHWWPWKGKAEYGWAPGTPNQDAARTRLLAQAEAGSPVEQRVYGEGDYLRSSFVQPYRCTRVLIEDVTILRSPMWEIHPVLCTDVVVRGVHVNSHGPNNDGCDPESSRRVVIEDCTFDTGDDCIAIKSGRNADGRRVGIPSSDILVQGCTMADGHGGLTIGSEMSGGVERVYVRDCAMSSPHLDIALRFKTNSVRGGFIRDVFIRDVTVGQVAKSVLDIDFSYEEGAGHGFDPDVSGIEIRDVTVRNAVRGLNVAGYPEAPVRDLRLFDVDLGHTTQPDAVRNVVGLQLVRTVENGAPLSRPPS